MRDVEVRYEWDGPPRIVLESLDVRTPNGRTYRHHRLRAGTGGAVIIARRENSLLFIRIARPAADDEVFLELPRGWANVGESPDEVTTAVRELAEETGLTASNARVLSSYVLDTGIYPQPVTVVACEVAGSAPQLPTDGEADYGSLWISAERLPGLVRDGRIRDGHSLAALAVWNADKNCP